MFERIAALALTIVAAIAPQAAADEAAALGAGDNCATHNEWDSVDVFMRPGTVADILGFNGEFRRQADDWFSRQYDVCWDSSRIGVVRYDEISALSISKSVKDR